jgi:hypothetical protein
MIVRPDREWLVDPEIADRESNRSRQRSHHPNTVFPFQSSRAPSAMEDRRSDTLNLGQTLADFSLGAAKRNRDPSPMAL